MISRDEIDNLASLARLSLTESEKAGLQTDMESILAYVGQLTEVTVTTPANEKQLVRNVIRSDSDPYPGGTYSEAIAEQFPGRQGDYLKVKPILGDDANA